MKKSIIILIWIGIFLITGVSCAARSETKKEEALTKLNDMVKEADFHRGEIKDFSVLLYDSEGNILSDTPIDRELSILQNIRFRKDGNILYFILDGSVDDENGIMFVNDASENSILDGIKHLDRVGRNSYRYSTYE